MIMKDKNIKAVFSSIEKTLRLKKGTINLNSNMSDIDNWDSFAHLEILITLDKIFKGKVADIKEMASATSIKKILQLLSKNKLI